MARPLLRSALNIIDWTRLPSTAKQCVQLDKRGLPQHAPNIDRPIDEAITCLISAQDNSASRDGGVARHCRLIDGVARSYTETAGYTVPMMIYFTNWRENPENSF